LSSADPSATHDVLAIVGRLGDLGSGATEAEVHCFAYLACAAWVGDGHPAEEWGYTFTALHSARPFSTVIDASIRACRQGGHLERSEEVVRLTASGIAVGQALAGSVADGGRRRYVLGACDVSTAISIPTALAALAMEPQLLRSAELDSERSLFDTLGRDLMSAELRALDANLPSDSGLFARMTMWVAYWGALSDRADRDFVLDD